jgi:hypothetical protein
MKKMAYMYRGAPLAIVVEELKNEGVVIFRFIGKSKSTHRIDTKAFKIMFEEYSTAEFAEESFALMEKARKAKKQNYLAGHIGKQLPRKDRAYHGQTNIPHDV